MVAKKKGGKKNGGKKAASNGTNNNNNNNGGGIDIVLPEDKIKYLEAQRQCLELQLSHKSEISASTTMEYQSMKQRYDETLEQYKAEKERTVILTRDMSRQYKGMQDQLLNKINERENQISSLTDELNNRKMKHEEDMKEKERIIERKDEYITKLTQKMEDVCFNFAQMMQDAMTQMKERIEAQSASYDDTSVPIQHRMEEFNFKSTSSMDMGIDMDMNMGMNMNSTTMTTSSS